MLLKRQKALDKGILDAMNILWDFSHIDKPPLQCPLIWLTLTLMKFQFFSYPRTKDSASLQKSTFKKHVTPNHR